MKRLKMKKTAKISTLSSGKVDNNEYFTGEWILPSINVKL